MSTPDLFLQTAFILNAEGRIISTREPDPSSGPAFTLVRSTKSCAWAARVDLPKKSIDELDNLVREEPPFLDLRDVPVYAERYMSLLGGRIESGPAFVFPDDIAQSPDIISIEDSKLLRRHFPRLTADIIPERSPILGVVVKGHAVSVCACARRSDVAAEAGLETAEAYRGRCFGPRVTAAWALAIRAFGHIPLYSTSWTNESSLIVARKLGLVAYASIWSLYG